VTNVPVEDGDCKALECSRCRGDLGEDVDAIALLGERVQRKRSLQRPIWLSPREWLEPARKRTDR